MNESEIAEFNRLVAKRKSMKLPGPTNSAAPSKAALQARADLTAANRKLAETKARLAAAQANLATTARVASVAPAVDPLAGRSDSDLRFLAAHRSASEATRTAAKAALESRGWTVHANGSFSQSITKKPRR